MSPVPKRGGASAQRISGEKMNVPLRVFLWTLDQVATMLNVQLKTVETSYVYYEGRSTGPRSVHLLAARNIAKPGDPTEWRIAEAELKRWLKVKGFKFYEPSQISY
jgi:hypothetical protein